MKIEGMGLSNSKDNVFFKWREVHFSHFTTQHHINYVVLALLFDWVSGTVTFCVTLLLLDNTLYSLPGMILATGFLWVLIFFCLSVYSYNPCRSAKGELISVIFGIIIAVCILSHILFLINSPIAILFFSIYLAIGITIALGWRLLIYQLVDILFSKHFIRPRRVLMIGVSNMGENVLHSVRLKSMGHIDFIGFVGIEDSDAGYDDLPMLCMLHDNLYSLLIKHNIHDILLTLPQHQSHRQEEIYKLLEHMPISVLKLTVHDKPISKSNKEKHFKAFKNIQTKSTPLTYEQLLIKRIFDLVFALVTLILALPLFLLIAIAIKLDSEGPVFFTQERVGNHGHIFKILKFRSMCNQAELLVDQVKTVDQYGRMVYKTRNDVRVTWVGRILRRSSLDELPQLLNVLKGDMTIVGPRPEVIHVVRDEYEDWQYRRFSVPQGITGWWQVNGRSETPCYQSTDQDIYYIENYSLRLDLKIILMTFPALFKGTGAF